MSAKSNNFYRKLVGYISTVAAFTTLHAMPQQTNTINDAMNRAGMSTYTHKIPPKPVTKSIMTVGMNETLSIFHF